MQVARAFPQVLVFFPTCTINEKAPLQAGLTCLPIRHERHGRHAGDRNYQKR
jgi:hypothetical protein